MVTIGNDADYADASRRFKQDDPPGSWDACNNKRKRLVLYKKQFHTLYNSRGRRGGQHPLPGCLKERTRSIYIPKFGVHPNLDGSNYTDDDTRVAD